MYNYIFCVVLITHGLHVIVTVLFFCRGDQQGEAGCRRAQLQPGQAGVLCTSYQYQHCEAVAHLFRRRIYTEEKAKVRAWIHIQFLRIRIQFFFSVRIRIQL